MKVQIASSQYESYSEYIHIVTFENLFLPGFKLLLQWMPILLPLKTFFVRVQIANCQVEISATGKATAGTKGDKVGWDTGDSENV